MQLPSLKNLSLMLFLPFRMITIFSALVAFQIVNVSWEIPITLFQTFFPVYIASFVIEVMVRDGGFKKNVRNIGSKYTIGVPVEFACVASSALLIFSSKPEEAHLMEIYVLIIGIICTIFVEVYHHYVVPKFAKKTLSDKQMVLIIIPFSVFLVFFGIYLTNSNPFS